MSRLEASELAVAGNMPSAKLLAETQHERRYPPTCKGAITSLHDLTCFSEGVVVGASTAAEGFIEFLATPGSVNKALIATGPALDTAVDYYAEKVSHSDYLGFSNDLRSVGNTVGAAINAYSEKDARTRGECCGALAFDMLVMESGAALFKASQAPFESTELASRRRAFVEGLNGLKSVDEEKGLEGLKTLRRFGTSPEFAAAIDREVSGLPEHVKRFLKSREIEVVPVRRLADVDPQIDRFTNGLYTQRSGKRFIFIAEEACGPSGAVDSNIGHCERLLRHEIGHALDHAGMGNTRWLTNSGQFRAALEEDLAAMDPDKRNDFLNWHANEGEAHKEAFAETYSYLTSKPDPRDPWRAYYTSSFSKTAAKMAESGLLDE